MHRFPPFLRSLPLAVGLLLVLICLSILATLIPQGREEVFYRERYGDAGAGILLSLGVDRLFRSPVFLVPAGAFALNLASCSVWRFAREIRRRSHRHGPDLLHLGLLVLLFGAILSGIGRREAFLWLAPGEGVTLPDGGAFVLDSFDIETYDDGRPRSYTSTGHYIDDGVLRDLSLSVNNPQRVGSLKLYQASFRQRPTLILNSSDGASAPFTLEEGERYAGWTFLGIQSRSDSWRAMASDDRGALRVFRAGEEWGTASVVAYRELTVTGLRALRDPGVPWVFGSFLVILLGFLWILRDKRSRR